MRTERDSLGEMRLPDDAYYGPQTARAVANYPVSGRRLPDEFIVATAQIKRAAALVNGRLGKLDGEKARAIAAAAKDIIDGALHEHFVVDVYQSGAGVSQHMNTNEVIANRAIEILGGSRGDYALVHPNDHVNMGQSTNDVIPTAIRISALSALEGLYAALTGLEDSLDGKARQFSHIVKAGRTHMQDAAPLTLGDEFGAYARAVARSRRLIHSAAENMRELGIGGTAVGTGLNTHPDYPKLVVEELSSMTGLALVCAEDLFEAMQSVQPVAVASSALRSLAMELIRICNDLRLVSSGPVTGLAEINLPALQPGSSIMPGKVNPVMPEMLTQVAFQVVGNDAAVAMVQQAGQLELNVMLPVLAWNILDSINILTNGIKAFTSKCVEGITANEAGCTRYAQASPGSAAALNPFIGYARAAEVAKKAVATGKTLREVVIEDGILSPEEADRIFSPRHLAGESGNAVQ